MAGTEWMLQNDISNRWRVLQPAIYLISILPVIVCGLVSKTQAPLIYFFWVGLAIVLIQHGINVFNDEVDWKKGADIEKKDSWYYFHHENVLALKAHAWVSFLFGTILGIALVLHLRREEVFLVALPLLFLGFFYNHSKWTLSYSAWGEWVTGVCYGPGVFGCMAYLFAPKFSVELVLGSLAFSFLAVAVLLSHQPPQVLTDFAAGKRSFAVRYGVDKTYFFARLLTQLCIFCLGIVFWIHLEGSSFFRFLFLLIVFILFVTLPQRLSPPLILKRACLLIFAITLCLGLAGRGAF